MKLPTHLLRTACGLALSAFALGSCTTSDTVDGANSTSTTEPVRTMQNNASISNNRDVTTPGTGTPTAPGNVQPMVTDRDVNSGMDNGTRTSTPTGTIDGSPDLPGGQNKTAPVEPVRTMRNNANISNNRDVTTPGTGTPVR